MQYCEYSMNDRLKFYAHRGPYDAETMKGLTQARFQCDADLAGNLDNLHSISTHIGYIGNKCCKFHGQDSGELVHFNG